MTRDSPRSRERDARNRFQGESGDEARDALEIGVLCNNASLAKHRNPSDPEGTGDPVELALLVAGHRCGIGRKELADRFPEVREVAFDPDIKMMATYHRSGSGFKVAVKGAPESVLAACQKVRSGSGINPISEKDRQSWGKRNEELAAMGLRILALAEKEVSEVDEEPYKNLVLAGLAAMEDPPRADVKPAIDACRQAGIRVVMVTGDQPITARHIAQEIGLIESECESVVTGKPDRIRRSRCRTDRRRPRPRARHPEAKTRPHRSPPPPWRNRRHDRRRRQ